MTGAVAKAGTAQAKPTPPESVARAAGRTTAPVAAGAKPGESQPQSAPTAAPSKAPAGAKLAKAREPAGEGPLIKRVTEVDRVKAARLAPAKGVAVPRRYTVQIGAFANKANAERLLAKLAAHFADGRIVPADVGGKRVYRVVSGSFTTKEQAAGRAEALKAKGYNTFVRVLAD